jgi:hypothetical protein
MELVMEWQHLAALLKEALFMGALLWFINILLRDNRNDDWAL